MNGLKINLQGVDYLHVIYTRIQLKNLEEASRVLGIIPWMWNLNDALYTVWRVPRYRLYILYPSQEYIK